MTSTFAQSQIQTFCEVFIDPRNGFTSKAATIHIFFVRQTVYLFLRTAGSLQVLQLYYICSYATVIRYLQSGKHHNVNPIFLIL